MFWWALAASIWGVLSDYLGARPDIRANGTSQLIISMISSLIAGQTREAGRRRRDLRNGRR